MMKFNEKNWFTSDKKNTLRKKISKNKSIRLT